MTCLLDCPAWVTKDQLPKRLDRKSIIAIDHDAPLWEEMSLGNLWVTLWGEVFEAAPAYIRDPSIRKGIKMVLQLDRIQEEEEHIILEQNNICNKFAHSFRLICLALHKYKSAFNRNGMRHCGLM
jgi:hypothetical protein